ncbi:MAG: thiamine pyrophosphate-dependent enzyme, partial [Bacteroidia bacterium]
MDKHAVVGNSEINAIDGLYTQYKQDSTSVEASWQDFFKGFEFAQANYDAPSGSLVLGKEFNVINLINGYRKTGHLFTHTNPVRERRTYTPTLDIENFGLAKADMDVVFQAGSLIGIGASKLSVIIEHLKATYCASIGVEYQYIRRPDIIEFLQTKMESAQNTPRFAIEEKKEILHKLTQAVVFENFLHTKFVGQKRFSLEGGEALIPALDVVIETAADLGVKDFVIGMAHRGRLNVLANILNKTYKDIFTEFEGRPSEDSLFNGDVKYHMGFSSDQKTNKGHDIHISLTPNPSHLEAVNPVVAGIVRAKGDNKHASDYSKVCPIII